MKTPPQSTAGYSDEQLAHLLNEARNVERGRLTHAFYNRLKALAAHINRYQLNGPEAAELLYLEEEKLHQQVEETY